MSYIIHDHYFKKAKDEGYRARSAYKLKMIQEKFHVIQLKDRVLDLGAAPGSWMQVVLEYLGPQGRIVGVDLENIEPLRDRRAEVMIGDVYDVEIQHIITSHGPYNVIISDMAPKTTGSKITDQARSLTLVEQVFFIATQCLMREGIVCAKVFEGADVQSFVKNTSHTYAKVSLFKPKASRGESFETYIIAQKKKV